MRKPEIFLFSADLPAKRTAAKAGDISADRKGDPPELCFSAHGDSDVE
jgi:hypothetical protein